jgi:uncharacterized SAM-dependent methyltransferase
MNLVENNKMNKTKTTIFSTREIKDIFKYLKEGDLPIKFSYKMQEIVHDWLDFENLNFQNNEFKTHAKYEADLLIKNFDLYNQIFSDQNQIIIFSFGPGDGLSEEEFLRKMSEEKEVIYYAFDISETVLKRNSQRIMNIPNLKYNKVVADFESGEFQKQVSDIRKKYNNQKVLSLFLGNTVGNFDSMHGILNTLTKSLSKTDKIIVGLANFNLNKVDEIVEMYSNEDSQRFFTSVLDYLGVDQKQYRYFVKFNFEKISVEIFAKFLEDVVVIKNDNKIIFKKNDELRIGISEKNNLEKLEKNQKELKLNIINKSISRDDDYIQLLYKK